MLALAMNTLLALVALLAVLMLADMAFAMPRSPIMLPASLFGFGAILLLWEAIAIVRHSRTGAMPIAMSPKRPLGLAALATIAIATILLLNLFAGIAED